MNFTPFSSRWAEIRLSSLLSVRIDHRPDEAAFEQVDAVLGSIQIIYSPLTSQIHRECAEKMSRPSRIRKRVLWAPQIANNPSKTLNPTTDYRREEISAGSEGFWASLPDRANATWLRAD